MDYEKIVKEAKNFCDDMLIMSEHLDKKEDIQRTRIAAINVIMFTTNYLLPPKENKELHNWWWGSYNEKFNILIQEREK